MRRSITSAVAGILCALLLSWGLPERAWAEDDVCANRQQQLHQFLTDLSLSLNQDLNRKVLTEALTEASASRPSSDGLASGGRLDLLRRAFIGLGLGQVTDEEGQLVFNFNPDALHLNSLGQFSPRIVVHKATIDGALGKYIDELDDEELRDPARDGLEKELGDLDDVEYSVRWTPKPLEPAEDLKEVASTLFDDVVPLQPSDFAKEINQAEGAIAAYVALNEDETTLPGTIPMDRICGDHRAKAALERIVGAMRTDIPRLNAALKEALTNNGFIRLADLIEGNPRLVINGNYRQRSGAAGADTTSIDVTWQRGWVSYRGAKKAAGGALTKASLDSYFAKHGRLEGAAPLFSLVASYAETNSFLVPIAGVEDPFSQDSGHKLSIKGTAGGYFGGGRDRKLELSAAYDDVSDDKNLQNRFVANLTWVETLNSTLAQAVGGSEFVATLVWANKPEFRGEVDEEFSLRAGLKWSLGSGTKKN